MLWGNDANGDRTINAADKNKFWRSENDQDYKYAQTQADFNLDGSVNAVDKNSYWSRNNSGVGHIP